MIFSIGDTVKYKREKRNEEFFKLLQCEKFFICDIGCDDSLSIGNNEYALRSTVNFVSDRTLNSARYPTLPGDFIHCRILLTEIV